MANRGLAVVSAVSLVIGIAAWGRVDAGLLAAQDPVPTDRLYFSYLPPIGSPLNTEGLVPRQPFPRASSQILIAANGTICLFDGQTHATSAPHQVFGAAYRGPVNFVSTNLSGRNVVFAAPAGNGTPPMTAFTFGPPHAPLGDFGMIEGGHEYGVSIAAGNLSGDDTPELALATATGGPGAVHVLQPGRDEINTFHPFGETYTGGIRLAAGDINGDGYDELITAQVRGGQVRFYEFLGLDETLVGTGFPFGQTEAFGAFIAALDVNNDGADEVVFGAGGGEPFVRLFDLHGPEPDPLAEFRAYDGTGGVFVAGGLLNGEPILATQSRPDGPTRQEMAAWFFRQEDHGWVQERLGSPFGANATPMTIFFGSLFAPR